MFKSTFRHYELERILIMRLCIIVRGPIRPNENAVLDNINVLLSNFKNTSFDILFASWKEDIAAVDRISRIIKPRFLLSEDLPEINFSFSEDKSFNPINCVKQFYLAKIAIDLAISSDSYDFIVHTRTDLKMLFDFSSWVNKDAYTTIHAKRCGHPFTNDQFGIAPPGLMKDAWSYSDFDTLCRNIDNCAYPEQIIDINIDNIKMNMRQGFASIWEITR